MIDLDVLKFKNFHRLLCERFNYPHDEQFWWRDQVSLIEHIAASIATANGVCQYLADDDMVSLIRFDECCEDSDSGGHDVSKQCMARLYEIGVVRSVGFGRSEMTTFGRYVIECFMEQKSSLPLLTYRDYELAAAPKQG